jgi:type IV pilus assembly protein PilM
MLHNGILAVDIGAGSLKLLYGNKKKVHAYQMMETPVGAMEDNKIVELNLIYNLIDSFIKENKLKPKYISFSIYGKDLIIRHTEIPYMKEDNVKQTVEWEIGRNLPNAGANYIIDFEILNRRTGKKDKVFQILAVAVLKERIENYLNLGKMLKLEIKAIDISANCTARVFKQLTNGKDAIKNVGVIDIGQNKAELTIIENGKLAMERQVPYGIDRIKEEISRINPELKYKEFDYIQRNFNINNTQSEIDIKINQLLDHMLTTFQKVIQFYTTGKIEKEISQIYVIGAGSSINGIDKIIHNYLTGSNVITEDPVTFGHKVKLLQEADLKYFVNTLGLLLREE